MTRDWKSQHNKKKNQNDNYLSGISKKLNYINSNKPQKWNKNTRKGVIRLVIVVVALHVAYHLPPTLL